MGKISRTTQHKARFEPYKRPADGASTSGGSKYGVGTHGYKKKEQAYLSDQFQTPVSGKTHESEHTIGFDVLNKTSGYKRKDRESHELENSAPAYQEAKRFHRDHIGTGTHGTADASGFNSQAYRDSQRKLLEQGDVSSAVQLNQLGYAFNPTFKQLPNTVEGKAANASYDRMVQNMRPVTYANGPGSTASVPVDAKQQAEMYLARRAAQSGQFPSVAEENATRSLFSLPPVAVDPK
jgi:hypothetical protein